MAEEPPANAKRGADAKNPGEARDTKQDSSKTHTARVTAETLRDGFAALCRIVARLVELGNAYCLEYTRKNAVITRLPVTVVALLFIAFFWWMLPITIALVLFCGVKIELRKSGETNKAAPEPPPAPDAAPPASRARSSKDTSVISSHDAAPFMSHLNTWRARYGFSPTETKNPVSSSSDISLSLRPAAGPSVTSGLRPSVTSSLRPSANPPAT